MPQTSARPLAIFGGTFDPVHLGHLSVAWEAAELLDAEVRLLPVSVPPHRAPPIATAAQRVAILRAALRGQSRLVLDTRELDREGPSYTIDTLHELRAEQGERPLVLLLGADAFAGLASWHRWRELFAAAHIGVLRRPGVSASLSEELEREVAGRRITELSALRRLPAGKVAELAVTPLEISATRIRELLAAGRDPRYLLPAGLFDDPALLAPYRC
ncbi:MULTISPECIES: nicotinate-nucleotide adenylyltransferase [Rhodanobacter]|uniref:nicotinate-nucleotide adenylyltransferase n=1 Tax=Rhodanobacter TaxID=75309 RepID=UPI000260F716|nr:MULTISPECIES: nicotinate-nucleotide adenylyltransferase [Rhodanobacter]EIM02750.1 nicotinate/nicotinamide nucleotide adenylyltransferase [Rhodanobacter denitrificans]KZC19246.1 nicotinic acid mononucleotide adenylyltransferase [Rhodanobacter denitrificans]UJJ52189.1 nicotinate-nucleotide adenylyltransferase [Rhodanobacter denitrificans]UJJ59031.1 nicotinate-nucleotide adenylyltransferase [Rhodanobacter denitrificans]UJM89494.1 nicotinate-nucleotide adenylyltransferase [Rhodanobacter denitri